MSRIRRPISFARSGPISTSTRISLLMSRSMTARSGCQRFRLLSRLPLLSVTRKILLKVKEAVDVLKRTTRDRIHEWGERRASGYSKPVFDRWRGKVCGHVAKDAQKQRKGRKKSGAFDGFYDVTRGIRGISHGSRPMRINAESTILSERNSTMHRPPPTRRVPRTGWSHR